MVVSRVFVYASGPCMCPDRGCGISSCRAGVVRPRLHRTALFMVASRLRRASLVPASRHRSWPKAARASPAAYRSWSAAGRSVAAPHRARGSLAARIVPVFRGRSAVCPAAASAPVEIGYDRRPPPRGGEIEAFDRTEIEATISDKILPFRLPSWSDVVSFDESVAE
ncbi:hypothetical protein NL676_007188 [Syzygium grande]|nr:hypothetical protein NL676_007188 [Syzygium grande]